MCCGLCCDGWCVPQPEGIVLFEAAKAGKLDEVEAAVDAGARMEGANPDDGGWRAVHAASYESTTGALLRSDVFIFIFLNITLTYYQHCQHQQPPPVQVGP